MGAANPKVRITVRKQLLPNAAADAGLLEALVKAEAIGRQMMGSEGRCAVTGHAADWRQAGGG